MPEHRRRRATQSGGGKPLAPFGLRAARTRLLCYGSSMVLGHHLCRRASYPDPLRLQHGLSDFCHGLLADEGCIAGRAQQSGSWIQNYANRDLLHEGGQSPLAAKGGREGSVLELLN